MKKIYSILWITAIILTSLAGLAAFIYLFVLDLNYPLFILLPVIFPFYQAPAVYLFWLWKKKKKKYIDNTSEKSK